MSEHEFCIWLSGYIEAIGTELLKDDIHNIKEKLNTVYLERFKPQSWFDPMGWYSDPKGTTIRLSDVPLPKYGDSWFDPKPVQINEDIGLPWALVTSTEAYPLTEEL